MIAKNLVLAALTVTVVVNAPAQTVAELAAFSRMAPGPVAAPWRVVGLPAQRKPFTRFDIVALDGQAALRVRADRSYGNLVQNWSWPARQLSWRWRLDQPLQRSDLRTRDGDDVALKVCVLFDLPTEGLPFSERVQLSLARSLSREPLPAATLCYVWDRLLPVGTLLPNAFTRRVRQIVVATGDTPLAQWQSQQRDLQQDFKLVFGAESAVVPPVVGFLVGADADNTADSSLGYVGDLSVLP